MEKDQVNRKRIYKFAGNVLNRVVMIVVLMLLICSMRMDVKAGVTSSANETIIYNYLVNNMGFSAAAACGIMANIEAESSYSTTAVGDSGTSYGLCQWHDERWDRLKTYCSSNGYDVTSVDGQIRYFDYEIRTYYSGVYNYLKSVANTSDGAYDAAYYFCYNFEVPANRAVVSVARGTIAKTSYWPVYGWKDTEKPVISNVTVTGASSTGYTVSCTVTDNVGVTSVKFPTWRSRFSSEGCTWYEGTQNGNTWTFTFKDAIFDDPYTTHIYAYDAAGNMSERANAGQTQCRRQAEAPTLEEGATYKFASALDNAQVIDIDGSNAQMWTSAENSENQEFYIVSAGDGYYKFVAKDSGLVLDVEGCVATNNTNLILYPDQGSEDQLFKFSSAGNGNYYIISKLGTYFDAYGGTVVNGTNVGMVRYYGGANQQWKLVKCHTHVYSITEEKKTTCNEVGYKVYTCSCGETYTEYDDVEYSDWSEQKPDDINENLIQEQKEYRYRTYETKTVTSASELSGTGWEQTGTNSYWSSYGSWSDWQDSAVSSSDSTKVETRTVYRYYYFLCPVCGGHEPFQGTSDCHQYTLTLANGVTGWFTIPYSQCNGQTYSYTTTRRYTESLGDGQRWNFSTSNINDTAPGTLDDGEGAVIIKTQYRYCTRSKVTEYTYRRATGWSDWTTDNSNFPSSAATESRTMYRYVTSGLKDHTRDEGVVTKEATCLEAGMMTYTCEVCGDVVTEEIPATGHIGDTEIRNQKDATEDEEGYTGDVYCADCGTLLEEGEVIEKLPPSSPQIVTQPVNYEGLEGSTASFTVEATGDELTYQWQYSPDYGKNWYNSSTKQAAYSIVLSSARNNRLVRCIITNAKGYQTISDAVSMTIVTPVQELKIVTQPTNYEGAEGSKATFSVKAEGESLTYQWQYSDDRGNNWYNSSGRSADFSIELTAKRNNRYMRCVIKDASGNEVTTDTVSMKIVTVTPTATPAPTQTLRIVTQPVNYEGVEGSKATFTLEAEGESLTYQWQYSDNKGANWYNSSTKTANFSIELTAKRNNRYMRCIVKDAAGNEVTTNTVTMKIVTATPTATPTPAQELRIVTQPVNYVGAEGSKAAFTVKAEGESLTYQWQYSDDQGSNWYNSSTKTADFNIELTTRRNGRYMRCIIKDASGSQVITNEVSMKIGTAAPTATPTPTPAESLRIVTQPVNYEGAEGSKATFTVVAEGEGLTYQWQYSDNKGKNWYNSSTKTAKFEIELTSRRNGRYMRCVITDADGNEVITNEVTMKISELLDTTASAVMSGEDLLLDTEPSEVMLGEELPNSETEQNSTIELPELSSDLLDDGSEMEISVEEAESTGDFELSDGTELGF